MNYENALRRTVRIGKSAARGTAKVLAIALGMVKYIAVGVAITICALALIIGLVRTDSEMDYGTLNPDETEELRITKKGE